ncbi:hypothetical protein MCUN1_002443 [Malassezia cuniculi]|uniref:Dynein heavy chain, cytoplasmic n=1 Tax=Malassezia cuniculi TaxID=948313 RepID=A0AAF0EZI3_9BASI|nr:hypothetical protein MCUN1_002443 [Malassezia cuniculi]
MPGETEPAAGHDPSGDWSDKACRAVVAELTASLDLGEWRDAVIDTIVWIHFDTYSLGERVRQWTSRPYYPSPQHLLALVHTFCNVITSQREQLEDQQRFRLGSLSKLRETVEQVEALQGSLAAKRARLEQTSAEANNRLQLMVHDQQAAELKQQASLALQSELAAHEAAVAEQRDSVLRQLSEAEPAVLDAQAAVSNIKKQHLSEVRTMANPPVAVKQTMESVCILLGHRIDGGWKTVQGIIRRDDFIASVVRLDTDALPRAARERLVREYLSRPEYNVDTISHASKACGPLASWVIAQVHYADILERVGPLRQQVAQLEDKARATRERAQDEQRIVAELEESIATYKSEYAALISETQAIKIEMERVQQRVARSVELLDGLASEKERWEAGSHTFAEILATLTGDSLLCAAYITLAGFFDQAYREAMWSRWRGRLERVGIRFRPELEFSSFLATADEKALWVSHGLHDDALSVDNAVMLQHCTRYPLVIDPSGSATSFLHSLYAEKRAAVTSFLDGSFPKVLEGALRFGQPLIVQDAEHFDPILLPVLNHELRRTGGRVLVRVGKLEVDYTPTFRLFLTTKDPNILLPPGVSSRVAVVNFTMTRKSLQAHTLAQILRAEHPALEERRAALLRVQGECQLRLRRLERALLSALNDAQGNILDDDTVVATLETLKAEADEVTAKAGETREIIADVERTTAEYAPLAEACSAVYFLLGQLSALDALYEFDLRYFMRIFEHVLNAPRQGSAAERRDALHKALFAETFRRTSAGLLHADHIVLLALLAQLYCRDGARAGCLDGAEYEWLTHAPLRGSDELPFLRRVSQDMAQRPAEWREFLESVSPERASVPIDAADAPETALIRQAILVKSFRPDRLEYALAALYAWVFGEPWESTVSLADIVTQVDATTPIALCSVPGTDASFQVEHAAAAARIKCTAVALGSSEALASAGAALSTAARSGGWVLLKNAHLAPAYLAELEQRLAALQPNEACRVFVTCEISPAVPRSFLRAARKVVHEPAAGLKAALISGLHTAHEKSSSGPVERARLHLLAAFLHASLCERLRYVPVGWSKALEFYDTDLVAALDMIDEVTADAAGGREHIDPANIPWEMIRALLKQSIYGCKMDVPTDRRMLDAFVDHLFVPNAFEDFVLAPGEPPLVAPEGVRLEQFISWAQGLPEPQPPAWLMLAPSAERSVAAARASSLVDKLVTMRELSRRQDALLHSAATDKDTMQDDSARMQKLAESSRSWLARLPERVPDNAGHASGALERFWQRERESLAALLETVRTDLEDVHALATLAAKRTNRGVALSEDLAAGRIPSDWLRYAVPSGTPVSAWIDDLAARVAHVGQTGAVQLGLAVSPSAFLTATRQVAAQHLGVSLDGLAPYLYLGETTSKPNAFPLAGMIIDGGFWDTTLHLNDGSSVPVDCTLEWKPPANGDGRRTAELAVYTNGDRQEILFYAEVAVDAAPETVVQRAVALRVA